MARWFSSGSRCSWRRLMAFCLLCYILISMYSFIGSVLEEAEKLNRAHFRNTGSIQLQELEQVEEMILPQPSGPEFREGTSLSDEFLNASSIHRPTFFPGATMDPRKNAENSSLYYHPGRIWLDNDGNPIHAHGGGVFLDEKLGTYFWYGEYKDGLTSRDQETGRARVEFTGVSCYSSWNLWEWKYEGIVLPAEESGTHDLHKTNVVERPRVIYNGETQKYVMWMHIDDSTYEKASIGVAISDCPTGPFRYLASKRPNGFDSQDLTVFKDDNGMAYLIYSSVKNKEIHISPLSQDYLDITNETARALVGFYREAPAVFKHQGIYYMITSGGGGGEPNEALVHEASWILGPWESIGNPFVGANKVFRVVAFFSRSTFVLPMPGTVPGTFIFMADRWNLDDLRDSRYVWLPLTVRAGDGRYEGLPMWSKVSIFWHEKWRIPPSGNGGLNQFPDLISQFEERNGEQVNSVDVSLENFDPY